MISAPVVDERCVFRPQIFYQEVSSWHICEASLDFKMNITTGINRAKFITDIELEEGPDERYNEAILNATKCVSSDLAKSDASLVTKKLVAATTWGDNENLGYILRSCYCSIESCIPSLLEASKRGFALCVRTLLDAGVPAASSDSQWNKTALHAACEAGQEEIASLLISRMTSISEVYIKCGFGETDRFSAFDILRGNDMSGIAKRLEAKAFSLFDLCTDADIDTDTDTDTTRCML
jgi:hypothetical protein